MKHSKQVPLELVTAQSQDFEDFILADEDVPVVSALKSRLPDFSYVWGAPGTGKTHVLNACRHWHERQTTKVMMVAAEQMKTVPIENVLPTDLALLLVDDVNVLAGNRADETLAFNLYNHCKANGISLIYSASISPRSKDWCLPDLRSRLNAGQILPLTVLAGEKALALFERQLVDKGITFDAAVLPYVEKHLSRDYPSLCQLLKTIETETLKEKHRLTVPLLKKINLSGL
ncbi:HdaA/DnaA family protein [Marinicella rhabdoformis]|uniref:HdaA/DnaA family protein n=1 Tax=Marinicella rhabdoformis TaxID=2580566 RepID=UPI0012AEBE94|nr:DnaA/Hda family protein [Marinicella rhabdoformis]